MRILFTGASSFTGSWFVKKLAAAGHQLVCPLRGEHAGEGLRGRRLDWIRPDCELVAQAEFGSDPFLDLASRGPFDVLCHHAAEVADYKSPDFDALEALQRNTRNLPSLLALLKSAGLRGVVVTGTYFEADEGRGEEPLEAFSPYGLSKGLTWQVVRYHCLKQRIPAGKFVIPNPFGPWEEPRFTGYLMQQWRQGIPAVVRTPDYVRDNIHADLLAETYAVFVADLVRPDGGLQRGINPSGYAESQGEFAARLAREVRRRTGWACELQLLEQKEFLEPRTRTNREPAAPMVPSWDESAAWDSFVEFYCR